MISTKVKRISNARDGLNESDFIDDDAALMQVYIRTNMMLIFFIRYQFLNLLFQAIALSLGEGDSSGKSVGNSATNITREDVQSKKYKEKMKESIGRKKTRKLVRNHSCY